ncbi:hypothetical protein Glove_368g3 [Diversispora epigaea]|uniref:Protein kinase domain-containing protein n=1 Tax=Diversispora epigaea TaxID=1348612 RepID=A0A397HEF8_9GLOM|nr:hypothetical protein Glove_368g3 [Diversispora epigaea]
MHNIVSRKLCVNQHLTGISITSFLRKKLREKKIDLFCDIIIGTKFLHGNKIIHCDLQSGNILLSRMIFISDLGFGQRVTVNSKNSKKPQMYEGEPYTFAPDIYSLGRRESTTGNKPFHDREQHEPNLILYFRWKATRDH